MAIDILTGLVAMVLFLLTDGFFHVAADTRTGVIVIAALYFCAGLLRGRTTPVNAWVKGLLVSTVGCAAFCVMTWNGVQHIELLILTSATISFAICGVHARRLPLSRSLTLALISFSLVALFADTGVPSLTTRFAVRNTMSPAPQFSMDGLEGKRIVSAALHGRVVVLDFWATWCPACRRELPEIDNLYRRYQSSPGVAIWAVDVNNGGETLAKAADFVRRHGYILPVAFDGGNESDRLLGDSGFPPCLCSTSRDEFVLFPAATTAQNA